MMEMSPLPREAALIVNAQSRKGEDLYDAARASLKSAGVKLLSMHAIKEPGELSKTVGAEVKAGVPMVIVGGGDGTLSGVVDELVGRDCVFGVLPLGTANSFARSLNLPLDLDAAVRVISHGRRARIDLGMIDGDYFVNGSSIGLPATVGETVPHKLKRYGGRLGYLAWAVKSAVRFCPYHVELDDGMETHRFWATELRILNGRYHGGIELSDHAGVDTHELLIQAVVGRSKLALGRDWYAKFFKLRSRNANSRDFQGQSFRIRTEPSQRISIDGEVLARTPVTARIAPGAIDVAVPA